MATANKNGVTESANALKNTSAKELREKVDNILSQAMDLRDNLDHLCSEKSFNLDEMYSDKLFDLTDNVQQVINGLLPIIGYTVYMDHETSSKD